MKDLKLPHLRTLTQVIELGTFSAAAERMGLSQPAVSLQIRQLEKSLGVRLIERVGKQATATQAGGELVRHAQEIDKAVFAAIDAMEAYAEGLPGKVRIGTGATAAIYLLPDVMRDLKRRFPELEISVRTGNTSDILKALEDNLLDIALVTMPAPGRMFDVTPIYQDDFVAIAASENDLLADLLTPADLVRLPVILYEAGGNTRRIVDKWIAQAGIAIKPMMELGSIEAIKELVGAGLGCAIIPGSAIRRKGESRLLIHRPLSPRLYRRLALVIRRDKPLRKGLRETRQALHRHLCDLSTQKVTEG